MKPSPFNYPIFLVAMMISFAALCCPEPIRVPCAIVWALVAVSCGLVYVRGTPPARHFPILAALCSWLPVSVIYTGAHNGEGPLIAIGSLMLVLYALFVADWAYGRFGRAPDARGNIVRDCSFESMETP